MLTRSDAFFFFLFFLSHATDVTLLKCKHITWVSRHLILILNNLIGSNSTLILLSYASFTSLSVAPFRIDSQINISPVYRKTVLFFFKPKSTDLRAVRRRGIIWFITFLSFPPEPWTRILSSQGPLRLLRLRPVPQS